MTDARKEASQKEFDYIMATDPDSDRMAIEIKPSEGNWLGVEGKDWIHFQANDAWALLLDYRLNKRKQLGQLPKDGFIIKSWVTTDLLREIADRYGLESIDTEIGFNKIAKAALKEIARRHDIPILNAEWTM